MLSVLVDDVRGCVRAEEHPHQYRSQDRPVQEVYRERVLPKPEQMFVREDGFDPAREVDAKRDTLESNAGVVARRVGVGGEYPAGHFEQKVGPGHPFWIVFGVGGEKEAGEDQHWGEDAFGPFSRCQPGDMRCVLGEIGEEGAEEELHPKCGCLVSGSSKYLEGGKVQSLLM